MAYLDRISTVPFHTIANVTLSAGAFTLDLNPTVLSSRLGAIADAYNNYRCTKLEFRLHPPAFSATNRVLTCGYVAGGSTAAPAALGSIEYQYMTLIRAAQTVPTNWVEIGREALRGPLPWYRAIPQASVDTTEESFGSLYFWSDDTTPVVIVELRGVFEFKDALDPALTLERRDARARRMQELEQLLSSLRVGPKGGLRLPTSK